MPSRDFGNTSKVTGSSRLREFAVSNFEASAIASNAPLDIHESGSVWFVEHGEVNFFIVEYREGAQCSLPIYISCAGPGRLIFGLDPARARAKVKFIGKGLPDTVLRRIPQRALLGAEFADGDSKSGYGPTSRHSHNAFKKEVILQLDKWIEATAAAAANSIKARPVVDEVVKPGWKTGQASGCLTSERGVVWLFGAGSSAVFLGSEYSDPKGPGLLPLTPNAWVEATDAGNVEFKSSAEIAQSYGMEKLLVDALGDFHRMAIDALVLNHRIQVADTVNYRRISSGWRTLFEQRARSDLYSAPHGSKENASDKAPLVAALEAIARHEQISIRVPESTGEGEQSPSLYEIVTFSKLRRRRIILSSMDRWWLGDSGAMLTFRKDDGHPVALLPGASGRYKSFDPATGDTTKIGVNSAKALQREAWFIYRPLSLDSGKRVSLANLFGVVGRGFAFDLARLAFTGLVSGLLTLAPAVAIGALVDRVILSDAESSLVQFTIFLIGVAVIAALAHVLRGTAVMRIEGRAATRVGAALMDRLLRVRPSIFASASSGELGTRLLTVQHVRDQLAGSVASSFLTTIFLFPAFMVIFFYSTKLGWIILGIGILATVAYSLFAAAQVQAHRAELTASRKISGGLLQFIAGIAKLRAARAEGAAVAAWANLYRRKKIAEAEAASKSEHVAAMSSMLPVLSGTAVVWVVLLENSENLRVSEFLIIFAVSQLFFNAISSLGSAFEAIAGFLPRCEEVRPILDAELEPTPDAGSRFQLSGEIVFDRICFRYDRNGPDILKDVTIRIKPGEFIAIVGESGAGKSTLVRLALGLEEPISGSIYFDGRNLSRLNCSEVRRQIGIVPHEGSLQPGTILSNIVGANYDYTIDDAWRAAKLACLDEDIAAMPMGMHTAISENGSDLSGGQRQRIAIAAALVRKPRIVILDEATGWLDSITQEKTMENIKEVSATRIAVAHRLSTTRKANRIYVLEAGRIIQEGTFEELSAVEGRFLDLIRRQRA